MLVNNLSTDTAPQYRVAADEVSVNGGVVAQVQFVKLVDGTADGTAGIPGGAGGLSVNQARATTGVAATAFTSTTSAVALSSNTNAKLRMIYNNSDQDCYVNLAAVVVSATSYHVKVIKNGGFFSTTDYSGEIRGIMAAAIGTGQVNFGEMT